MREAHQFQLMSLLQGNSQKTISIHAPAKEATKPVRQSEAQIAYYNPRLWQLHPFIHNV